MFKMLKTFWVLPFLVLGCGNESETLDEITWLNTIRPIFSANCVRCHTVPSIDGAPDTFRLDVWDETIDEDGTRILGAGQMAEFAASRTSNRTMPPSFSLSQENIDAIGDWFIQEGVNVAAAEGTPNPENNLPQIELLNPPEINDDGLLILNVEIDDDDNEIVTGNLFLRQGAVDTMLSRSLHHGRVTIESSVAHLAEGSYEIIAELDDGNEGVELNAGSVQITQPNGNHAPLASFINSQKFVLLTDFDLIQRTVGVAVEDVDGDPISLVVRMESRAGEVEIYNENTVMGGATSFEVDISQVPEGNDWFLVAEVSDGERSTESRTGPIFVRRGAATQLGFQDIAPVTDVCLQCHAGANRVPGLTFNLGNYGEFFERRGNIFRRVVLSRTMPPTSGGSLDLSLIHI